ncbi:MAG: hypothetical protein AABY75_03185 [Bacteroidota bacterium]
MNSCVHCTRGLPVGEDSCLWCGRWQNGHMPMCESHESTPSFGVCVVCGRPVCASCAETHDGRLLCDDRAHHEVAESNLLLVTLPSEFEADWIVTNLRQTGVAAVQYSMRSYATAWWFPTARPVRVFVPAAEANKARELLSRFDDLTLFSERR